MNGNKGKDDRNGRNDWPWWGQLILAIVALTVAGFLLIFIPMKIVPEAVGGEAMVTNLPFTTMIVVFVGLTTMTISAMFLFMTFRIDRGTKATAREEAQKVAEKVAVEKMTEEAVGAIRGIRVTGRRASARIEEVGNEARARTEEAGNEARARTEEAGNEARARIEEAGNEACARTEEAGNEAGDRIEKAGNEAEELIAHATEKTRESVDSMIEDARKQIDEANIETLMNERLDTFLEQADGWPRRLFLRFLRRREPRP